MNYSYLAMCLGMHVRDYALDTWRAWIRDYYISSPSFSAEETEILAIGHKIGALEKAINYIKKQENLN